MLFSAPRTTDQHRHCPMSQSARRHPQRLLSRLWQPFNYPQLRQAQLEKLLPDRRITLGDICHSIRFEVSSRPLSVPIQSTIYLAASIFPKTPDRPGSLHPHLSPRILGNTTIPTSKPAGYGFCTLRVLASFWRHFECFFRALSRVPADHGSR